MPTVVKANYLVNKEIEGRARVKRENSVWTKQHGNPISMGKVRPGVNRSSISPAVPPLNHGRDSVIPATNPSIPGLPSRSHMKTSVVPSIPTYTRSQMSTGETYPQAFHAYPAVSANHRRGYNIRNSYKMTVA